MKASCFGAIQTRMMTCSQLPLFLAVVLLLLHSPASSGQETTTFEVSAVTIEDLQEREGVVTGRVVNHSESLVQDVRLLIRYSWLWKNERNPGDDNPGRAAFYVVPVPVPARGELRFSYRTDPPLPTRQDGSFRVSAEVVSFSEVEPSE